MIPEQPTVTLRTHSLQTFVVDLGAQKENKSCGRLLSVLSLKVPTGKTALGSKNNWQ